MIVEVPVSQAAVRTQLEQLLGGPPKSDGTLPNGAKAVPLEFWGWRIYDVSHQLALVDSKTHKSRTMAELKKGHQHGSKYVATLCDRFFCIGLRRVRL